MENQNCCEDGKQLRVNADKKRQTARLICNICCSLVLKRSIIISRLIGITAEPGCAQQTDKPKHANAAAKRCKPTAFYKISCDRQKRLQVRNTAYQVFSVPSVSYIFLPENKNILNSRIKYLCNFVRQKNGRIVSIVFQRNNGLPRYTKQACKLLLRQPACFTFFRNAVFHVYTSFQKVKFALH